MNGKTTKLTLSLLMTEGKYRIVAWKECGQKQPGRLKTSYQHLQARTKDPFYTSGQNSRLPGRESNLEHPTFSRIATLRLFGKDLFVL
jgi:hypothetical protein